MNMNQQPDLSSTMSYGDAPVQEEENAKKKKPKKSKYKKSVFFRFVALFVFLSLVVMVIDPMTTNVNEGEIIFRAVFYPYFKIKERFEEEVEDFDTDGISDYDEIHGWDMPSDVLVLKRKGDVVKYRFTTERQGDHVLSFRYFTASDTSLTCSLHATSMNTTVIQKTLNSTGSNYEEELIFEKFEFLGRDVVEFTVQMEKNITLKIDWLRFQKIGEFFGTVLDGDDYFYTSSAYEDSPITTGTDTINYRTDWKNPDSDFDGMLDGYELATGRLNEGWSDPMVTNRRYAVLIGGGTVNQEGNYQAFSNAVITVYESLHNTYGYLNANIHVLFWDGKPLAIDIVDDDGSIASIEATFDSLSQTSTRNDLLFVYFTSHGTYNETRNKGSALVYSDPATSSGELPLPYDKLAEVMGNVTAAEKILVIEACNSGSAALAFDVGDNVQIYTSSTKDDETFVYPNGNPPFTHHLMQALTNPILGSVPTFTEIKNLDIELEESEFISIGKAYEKSRGKLGLSLNGSPLEAWSNQQPQQNDVAELKGKEIYL